ncbi:MAG: hypothetical protein M3495_19565 [Pseudomonadota bacterium]|nr:hypothetical protein [Pseudomonadota bacterium]
MSGGKYDYVAISVDPENIFVICASLPTREIFHLNAKSPDALMLADRFPSRREMWCSSIACCTKKGESSYAFRGTDFEPPYRISEARCTAGTWSP